MTQTEILNSTRTKTWKMQQLLGLGLTRREVATLMNCSYGFVQNVYARMNNRIEIPGNSNYILRNFVFNHTFGVEIEATGIRSQELKAQLNYAGIDIETEGYNHNLRDHWKIVNDGSLSGSNCFELVSPKLQGQQGLQQLRTVLLIVRGLEAKVNRTCGLHIHFDASNFDLKTWKNILWNYAFLEKEIDSFMPTSRREDNNYYCRSLKRENYDSFYQNFSTSQNLESGLNSLRGFYRNDRYYKINLLSFIRHHSIEFRQHSGTVNYEKISNWIIFLARLIEFSKESALTGIPNFETLNRFLNSETYRFFETRQQELRRA